MKRLSILCLVVAGMLYSASAFASVCFLADTACQQGQYQVDDRRPCLEQNSNLVYEGKRCMGLIYGGVVCNDSTGNYFEEGSCPAGYVDFSTVDQDKYECGNSLLCDRCCNDVRCKNKFKKCENNSVPANTNPDNTCQETWSDNSIKYTECVCQNPYNQTCDGKGVTTSGNYCIDSNGKTFWSACQCDNGYFETSYANIKCPSSCTYGCLNLGTYTPLPGTSNYCWSGAECAPEPEKPAETCKIVYQSDFDNFWEGYDAATNCRNLTVNCAILGYDTGKADTGVMCKDGTEPYRCPFDHTAVYCESGIEDSGCQYTTQSTCEMSYFGSTCTPDSKGCWNPNACKDGYGKTTTQCSGGVAGWELGSADEFGCALCQCTSTCKNYTGGKPEHAQYTTATCESCGKKETVTTGWECISPFVNNESNTDCVCPVVCPEPMTTKPAHSHFKTTECNKCGEIEEINTFWECDDGFRYEKSCDCCVLDTDCKSFVGTTCMPHAQCTSDTTNGVTIYTFSKCDEADGYFLANCECVCTQTCSDKVTTKPENSYYVEADCKACGTITKIKDHWECNSGYHKNTAGTSCVADVTESCESKGYNSNPVYNNTYCERVTISINGTSTTCFDCKTCDNQGLIEVKSCEKLCNKFAPDGQSRAYYKFYTIENIDFYDRNNKSTCYRGDLQNHKSDCCCQGSGAVALADCEEPIEPEDCPAGYASTVGECGSQGVAGWELGAKYGSMNCYECKARTCPLVAVSGFGTGSATRDVQSTTSNNVANCGSYAGNGWNIVATGKYSGDNQCYVCQPKSCPIGYKSGVSSVADCGAQAANGWAFSASNLANGNEPCGKCEKLKCPGNSSTEISSRKDCDKKYGENGYYDFNSVIEGYSGDKECHSCSGVQACDDIGLVDYNNSNQNCIEVSVLGYDQKMITCYDCSGGSHDCGQGYVLVNGECKPTYESCEAANLYTQPPEGNNYCNNIDIWLPSGQKETCYDCTADGCCETCADHCSWNIEHCSDFVHCRTLCERKYGATCSGGYYY